MIGLNAGQNAIRIVITALDKASATINRVQKKTGLLQKNVLNVTSTMALGGVAAMGALGAASIKLAADFDTQMRAANQMMKLNKDAFATMKQDARKLAVETGKDANEIAKGLYTAASAGFRGAEALEVVRMTAKGAAAGLGDVGVTTETVVKALNIFGYEGDRAQEVMDKMFGIVDAGLLTFEELSNSFPRAATSAGALGISLNEVGASLATVTKTAGSTEQAATAIDGVLTGLMKPTEELKNLIKSWGYENAQAAIEAEGFTGVLDRLKEATHGDVEATAELFANKRALRALFPIIGESAEDYAEALDLVADSEGKTNELFEDMAEGPGFKLNQMFLKVKDVLMTIGDRIAPPFIDLLDDMSGMLDENSELAENIAITFKGIAYAIEHVMDWTRGWLILLEKLAEAIDTVTGLSDKLGEAMSKEYDYQVKGMEAEMKRMKIQRERAKRLEEEVKGTEELTEAEKDAINTTEGLGEAMEETSEQSQEAAEEAQKAFEDAVGVIKSLRGEIEDSYKEIEEIAKDYAQQRQDITASYEDKIVNAVSDAQEKIEELEEEKKNKTAEIEEEKQKLIEELRKKRAESEKGIHSEEINELNRRVQEESKLLDKQKKEELKGLDKQIKEEQEVIDTFYERHKDLEDELQEHKEYLEMNEIERLEYDMRQKIEIARKEALEKQTLATAELNTKIRMHNQAMAMVSDEKKAYIEAEIEKSKTFREKLDERFNDFNIWTAKIKDKYRELTKLPAIAVPEIQVPYSLNLDASGISSSNIANEVVNVFKSAIGSISNYKMIDGNLAQRIPGLAESIPGFQEGGIVPGRIGEPVPAIVHGGETVVPAGENMGNTYNFDFSGAVIGSIDDLKREIKDYIDRQTELKRLSGE